MTKPTIRYHGFVRSDLRNDTMELHDTIKFLLIEISKLPSAADIVVFGSVAKRATKPGDLDIALVPKDYVKWSEALEQHRPCIDSLLVLASKNYGWLDPFVVKKSDLVVRNDEATGWKLATNAAQIKQAIKNDGVPILDLVRELRLSAQPRKSDARAMAPDL